MDGMLGKQTKNKNWPVRFAILTTGLLLPLSFFYVVHNFPFHMKFGVVEHQVNNKKMMMTISLCVCVCVSVLGLDALYFYAYKTSDMTKGVVPVSNLTELYDMPKGPGFMSGFFFSITFVSHVFK